MNRKAAPAPWPELEQQAYYAYREWPLWLVLRARELEGHLAGTKGRSAAPTPPPVQRSEREGKG